MKDRAADWGNSLFGYAVSTYTHMHAHTHIDAPLSKTKWGLQTNTLGFSAGDCSYKLGVTLLNEAKCPNGKIEDPKWGITKRIWIPPTAHTGRS